VRWNRRSLFHLLQRSGADALALAYRPYDESRTWSSLHHFADQAHNDNLELVDDLVTAGVSIDGDPAQSIETLHIAVRRNALYLTDLLRNAVHVTNQPSSPYGIRPYRGAECAPQLPWLALHDRCRGGLHCRASAGPQRPPSVCHSAERARIRRWNITVARKFDWETNSAIALELRTGFAKPEQLSLCCILLPRMETLEW
jgi:hypothetical protein